MMDLARLKALAKAAECRFYDSPQCVEFRNALQDAALLALIARYERMEKALRGIVELQNDRTDADLTMNAVWLARAALSPEEK
jgi:hypothetical protein